MERFICIFVALCCFFTPFNSLQAQPALIINTPSRPPYSYPDQSGVSDMLIIEAFKRIGVGVEIQFLPPERAITNANNGVEDGDGPRIAGLTKNYPNLLKVPEKILDIEFVAFTNRFTFSTDNWQSLQPYDVAIINGHKISEKNVAGTKSLIRSSNLNELFRLLEKHRAEVVISEKIFGLYAAKELDLKDVMIMSPPLAKLEMFLYVHKRHQELVLQLAESIKAMKADGVYKRILGRLDKFLP